MAQLTRNITNLKVDIGETFREDFEKALIGINSFLEGIREMDPTLKKVIILGGMWGTTLAEVTAAYKVGSSMIDMYTKSKAAVTAAAAKNANIVRNCIEIEKSIAGRETTTGACDLG